VRRLARVGLRILAGLGVLFLVLITLASAFRLPLAEWALRNALADVGVSPRDLKVTDLRWRHATIAPLDVDWHAQRLQVEALTIDRPDLFGRSLGHVTARGITATLDLAALTVAGRAPPAALAGQAGKAEPAAPRISFDDLLVEGRLVLRTPQAEQALTLLLSAKPDATGSGVQVDLALTAPGLDAKAKGHCDFTRFTAEFELPGAQVDLAGEWRFLRPIAPEPFKGWEIGGRMTVTARGLVVDGRLAGEVEVHLRDGFLSDPGTKVSVQGIESDVVFSDPAHLATAPAQWLRVRETSVGDIVLRDALVRFQFKGLHACQIESAEVTAFDGKVLVDPCAFDPAMVDYRATLRFEGVAMGKILALFPDVRAKATGRADGRLPIRYGEQGFSFGQGWLALSDRQPGTLQIDQPGLLTGNLSPGSAAYATLKAVETGLLNLRVNELRAEIYPANAPAGRSVQIHIAGEPLDPTVKAPVTFDVNVNGPIEKLVQWGLDSRMKFSSQ
jgi:hypothetical protein